MSVNYSISPWIWRALICIPLFLKRAQHPYPGKQRKTVHFPLGYLGVAAVSRVPGKHSCDVTCTFGSGSPVVVINQMYHPWQFWRLWPQKATEATTDCTAWHRLVAVATWAQLPGLTKWRWTCFGEASTVVKNANFWTRQTWLWALALPVPLVWLWASHWTPPSLQSHSTSAKLRDTVRTEWGKCTARIKHRVWSIENLQEG